MVLLIDIFQGLSKGHFFSHNYYYAVVHGVYSPLDRFRKTA